MEQFVNLLNKYFDKPATALLFGLCGVAASFVVLLVLGCFCGDFAKAKRGLKLVSSGRLNEGQEKLKTGAIGFYSETEGLDFEAVVLQPFAYSLTKRMAPVLLALTAFFSGLSLFASLALSGVFTGHNTFVFLTVFGSGLALCSVLLAMTSSLLRAATYYFYKARELLLPEDIPQKQRGQGGRGAQDKRASQGAKRQRKETENAYGAGDFQGDYADELPAEIISLCTRIEEVALTGGANHSTLGRLYSEIKDLQQSSLSPAAEAKLAAALEVLIVLIDSAL